jgi:glycerol-3-phosphate cytidylyltransferase-like family protein
MRSIYFPMTVNILTAGHIKVLEKLAGMGFITVGLLTSKALKGYKEELMPFEDRLYIMNTLMWGIGNMEVVPQHSLDPAPNIKKHGCTAIASGDGFEEVELEAIKKLGLEKINIKLPGEKEKQYSSTQIWKRNASC